MALDSEHTKSELSPSRWGMLAICWFAIFFMYSSWYIILVLFGPEGPILFIDGSSVEAYLVWTFPLVGLTCIALPAGLLVDKYGLKKTGILGLSILVVTTVCRGLSYDFLTMSLSSIFLGVGVGVMFPIGGKLISLWFGEKEIGTASGIRVMAAGLGIAISQSIAVLLLLPWLGSWRYIFFFYAFCLLIILFLWFFIKEKPVSFVKRDRAPFRESLSKVIHNKYVWMLGVINLLLLAVYLTGLKALHPIFEVQMGKTLADIAISMISYGAMVANVIMPILSDRASNRRHFLLMAIIVLIPSLLLINFLGEIGIWTLSFVIGFMVGTIAPIAATIPIELKGVGHLYIAGASGFMTTIGRIGGFIGPMIYLFIITSTAVEIYGFIFLSILLMVGIILVKLLPETAGKAREALVEIE